MLSLLKKKTEQKQVQKEKMTAQRLIPVKAIQPGLILTEKNQLVKVLKISTLNLELMGAYKQNQTFKKYTSFLQGVRYPIQETVVSQPVDLTSYVNSQKAVLDAVEGNRRQVLLNRYIEYVKLFERNQNLIMRQRYLMFTVDIKKDTERGFHTALNEVADKTAEITRKFKSMELTVKEATPSEIIRYLHTLFDYKTAQNVALKDAELQPILTGGNNNEN